MTSLALRTSAGRQVAYAPWGQGRTWIASLSVVGSAFEPVTRWFTSRAAAEAWCESVLHAETDDLWDAAFAPEWRAQ